MLEGIGWESRLGGDRLSLIACIGDKRNGTLGSHMDALTNEFTAVLVGSRVLE